MIARCHGCRKRIASVSPGVVEPGERCWHYDCLIGAEGPTSTKAPTAKVVDAGVDDAAPRRPSPPLREIDGGKAA